MPTLSGKASVPLNTLIGVKPSSNGPTPPPVPGIGQVTWRHLTRIVWPRIIWLLAHTPLGLLLATVLVVLGSIYWIGFDRFLHLPGWWGALFVVALFTVVLPVMTLVQFGILGRTGRFGYATDHSVLVVQVRDSAEPTQHRAADWWLGEHYSWPDGVHHGAVLRAQVFPHLAIAALAADCELVGEVRSPRVLAMYRDEGWLTGATIQDHAKTRRWRMPGSPRWAVRWSLEALQAMANAG